MGNNTNDDVSDIPGIKQTINDFSDFKSHEINLSNTGLENSKYDANEGDVGVVDANNNVEKEKE